MAVTALASVVPRVAPVALAGEQTLPVLPTLEPLLPAGLRRGTVVGVGGGPGATALALALVAGPSRSGSWTAVTGLPTIGLGAAAELGVAPERLLIVRGSGSTGGVGEATIVAALVDGVDVVLTGHRLGAADARRLVARARERGTVLVAPSWPVAVDVRLEVQAATWDVPHGRLAARRLHVVAAGRGAAARPRHAELWLPGPGGAPEPVLEERVAPLRGLA